MDVRALEIAIGGGALLGASVLGARHPVIHPLEARAFHAVNGLPGWLYPVLWAPMQLGNLVVGTVVGLVVAWAVGSWAVALGVVLAMLLKLVVERLVRREVEQYLQVRQRPGTSQVGAILRGDVPSSGPSFPSGHVILVAAISTVLTPQLSSPVIFIPFVMAVLVALGRVYVGAHNPLDVTSGFGAGLLIGGLLALVLR
ncbi:phosphatase PAP2 family protein [Aquihabitans sp. McL0605]|uniref:phosphatase PAP2 family protein n=1 Tax=Aquihabitans sp. McL0605 TaxID=3415671 RepID=UPI003CEE5EE5